MKSIDTLTSENLAALVCWCSTESVPVSELQAALDKGGVNDFHLPQVACPQAAFAAIMRSHYHKRFETEGGSIERTLLLTPLVTRATSNVPRVPYTVNLATRVGKAENDLGQVASIVYDAATDMIEVEIMTDDAQVLRVVNKMVADIDKEYRATVGRLTAVEINAAVTNYIDALPGSMRTLSHTHQNWLVPNVPTMGKGNPAFRIERLAKAISDAFDGMEMLATPLVNTSDAVSKISKRSYATIISKLDKISDEIHEVVQAGKVNKNRRRRLESEMDALAYYLVIYSEMLSENFKSECKHRIVRYSKALESI